MKIAIFNFCAFLSTLVAVIIIPCSANDNEDQRHPSTNSNPVLCRRCGRPVADPAYIRPNLEVSPFDSLQRNVSSLFGQKGDFPVQSLVNPHGAKFDLVLFQKAGCQGVQGWVGADTWYPGYSWRVCTCPHCGQHLGWMFQPEDDIEDKQEAPTGIGFYGMILDKLIDEEFASSLLIKSKPNENKK